ncbi:DUF6545 domain-containing protein [Umezawaea sp.]|uniref:DUF6545 domain-containing protein n=1 Tax=Umezawaea sp. TaxID=1955258 RepID=UPI002ED2F9DF
MPGWITISATAFIVAIAVVRLVLVRHTTVYGRLINTLLGLDAAAALLREPVVARHVAGAVPGGLPTVFDAWHWLTVMAWACGLGLALVHRHDVPHYQTRFRVVLGLAAAVGIAFLTLSDPARARGLASVADHGGWRYGVYVLLYSAVPLAVSSYYYAMSRSVGVWRTTTLRERVMVAALVSFGVASSLPTCVVAASAALDAAGLSDGFARDVFTVVSEGLTSGEPGLFVFAAVVVVFVPSSAQAVMRLLRLDRESRAARRTYPLWRDLTRAAPQVVFELKPADNWKVSPQECLHRRRIEIHDAAELVARYVQPLPPVVDELIENTAREEDQEHIRLVAEMVLAAERLADNRGEPAVGEAYVPDERTLLRFWQPAKSLVRAADHTAERR